MWQPIEIAPFDCDLEIAFINKALCFHVVVY